MNLKKVASLVLILLAGASLFAYANQQTPTTSISSYVLYAQDQQGETAALLRTIEPSLDANCPSLLIDNDANKKVSMQVRENPSPIDFPITVCEALYPKNTQLFLMGKALLKPSYTSEHVAVFGDSGCKASKQDCSLNSDNWFFNKLSNIAAKTKPDVVLHMGDYNYSGTPGSIHIKGKKSKVQVYDAGDNTTQGMCKIAGPYYGQNSEGSEFKDSWKYWQQDFFKPAQPLLNSAPWVFARGNHELCSRAGEGWFYLLDSNSPLLGKYANQLSCPKANNPTPTIFSQPYIVNLDKANILVLDSTNACDSGLLNLEQYQNQFQLAKRMLTTQPNGFNILQTHRPLFGFDELAQVGVCGDNQNSTLCPMSQTLQQANLLTGLSDDLQLVISGHMHRFQSVNFDDSTRPAQLIVGTSGVSLAGNYPKQATQLEEGKEKIYINGISEYGYLKLLLSPEAAWTANLISTKSKVLLACQPGQQQLCTSL